ncbi:hypothetical protein HMPREF2638_10365 [Neisseria sp. HMSC055F11]|nr:hypothetical protein HMPREF2638_10365 [Neisseria sp. HMSC055F11]
MAKGRLKIEKAPRLRGFFYFQTTMDNVHSNKNGYRLISREMENDSWYFKKDVRGKKILKFQNSSLF